MHWENEHDSIAAICFETCSVARKVEAAHFIADTPVRGGALRMLTVLDERNRECHVRRADRALKSADVIAVIKQAITQFYALEFIRSDNRSEFITHEPQAWLAAEQIKTIYIEPASPWQNGFLESFRGAFRDECLTREQLWTFNHRAGRYRGLPH